MKAETAEIKVVGGRQTIVLPLSLSIDDNKVYVKKDGNVLHLIPYHDPWQSLAESLNEFSEDFMQERTQPGHQIRESLD